LISWFLISFVCVGLLFNLISNNVFIVNILPFASQSLHLISLLIKLSRNYWLLTK
jgi:hypothetical protein